ncbi:MAG: transglutaminase-like domain-containing protein, partial [Candidatus Sulfotelmatobacter sp.]
LKLIHKRPELGWPELEAENQQVIEKTANYVVLEVRRVKPKVAAGRPASDASAAPFLAPNALMQSDDANIQAIAAKVVGNEHDAWRAAQALQRWTNDNMKFDMGIAIAPASEVARNRRGTCFGYSMLLGSLTRAAGIPSRLRMGYVYAGGIWGGHAWIEVSIGNSWIPIDGALYSPGAADAARFSFFTSALEDGTLDGVGGLGQLFSNVDVKILQYTVGGKSVDVAEGAPAFTVSGNDYRNPWIGLSIRKPPSFKFGDLGAAWPQGDLVSMEGARGETIKVKNLSASLPTGEFDLRQEFAEEGIRGKSAPVMIDGRKGTLVSSGHKAEAVLVSGGNIWAITSAGPHAKALLEQVLATMRLDN